MKTRENEEKKKKKSEGNKQKRKVQCGTSEEYNRTQRYETPLENTCKTRYAWYTYLVCLLAPQSRFGCKPLEVSGVRPQIGTAVLKESIATGCIY